MKLEEEERKETRKFEEREGNTRKQTNRSWEKMQESWTTGKKIEMKQGRP